MGWAGLGPAATAAAAGETTMSSTPVKASVPTPHGASRSRDLAIAVGDAGSASVDPAVWRDAVVCASASWGLV